MLIAVVRHHCEWAVVPSGMCVLSLTHKLTRNRKFLCGNSGTDRIQEYLISEQTPPNELESIRFNSSDKLRTRRPGGRIPWGVPKPRKFIEFPWLCFYFLYFFECSNFEMFV